LRNDIKIRVRIKHRSKTPAIKLRQAKQRGTRLQNGAAPSKHKVTGTSPIAAQSHGTAVETEAWSSTVRREGIATSERSSAVKAQGHGAVVRRSAESRNRRRDGGTTPFVEARGKGNATPKRSSSVTKPGRSRPSQCRVTELLPR
jgi:hypothetical protein